MKQTCLICGGERTWRHVFDAPDIIGGELFSIFECDNCGVKRVMPVPGDLARYYSTDMGRAMVSIQNRMHLFLKSVLLGRECSRIARYLGANTLFDVGCGAGDFSYILDRKGFSAVCIDSSPDKPGLIKDTQIPYYTINYSDYSIAALNDMAGGCVIARHVLEHLSDPGAFIDLMLSKGASSFYIVCPITFWMKHNWLGIYNSFLDPPRHLWHFHDRSMEMLLKKHRLEILAHGYDTIPAIIPSLYRFLRLKNISSLFYRWFDPKGTFATISLPLDYLFPNNVMWYIARKS